MHNKLVIVIFLRSRNNFKDTGKYFQVEKVTVEKRSLLSLFFG